MANKNKDAKHIKYWQWLTYDPDAEKYRNALLACHLILDEDLKNLTVSLVRETGMEYFNRHVSAKDWHEDPIEKIIDTALVENDIPRVRNYPRSKQGEKGRELDFNLPCSVSIEVKRYHTERSMEVLKKNKNVILIQGQQAAITFRELLGRKNNKEIEALKRLKISISL